MPAHAPMPEERSEITRAAAAAKTLPSEMSDSRSSLGSSAPSQHHNYSSGSSTASANSSTSDFYEISLNDSGEVAVDPGALPGPPNSTGIGVYIHDNRQFYTLARTDSTEVKEWDKDRQQWVATRNAYFQNLVLKAFPFLIQGIGRLVPGIAGNAIYLTGVAWQGLDGAVQAGRQLHRAYRGRDVNGAVLLGGTLQALGAGARAAGQYSPFGLHPGYDIQAAGNMALAAGSAMSAFPGPAPRSLPPSVPTAAVTTANASASRSHHPPASSRPQGIITPTVTSSPRASANRTALFRTRW
jgi:hypothetical protein